MGKIINIFIDVLRSIRLWFRKKTKFNSIQTDILLFPLNISEKQRKTGNSRGFFVLPNQLKAVALLLEGSNHDKVKEINSQRQFEK